MPKTEVTEATPTSGSSGSTMQIKFAAPLPLPVPARDMFDVEVFGPEAVRLIPRNELGKSLCRMWLHMKPKTVLLSHIKEKNGHHNYLWAYDVDAIELQFSERAHLTKPDFDGCGLSHERAISEEEHDVALAAIEAHRAAKKAAPPAPEKRSSRKRAAR